MTNPTANERITIMTKKQVGVVTVIAVVGALGFVSFKVGLLAGAAHKVIEK